MKLRATPVDAAAVMKQCAYCKTMFYQSNTHKLIAIYSQHANSQGSSTAGVNLQGAELSWQVMT